ncbi:MAG: CbtA family protein, partial [Gammaproteobacteria bacterium]
MASCAAGIGFALLLCALYARRERVGVPQSALFGMGGVVVFYLSPALGLPPELPGTGSRSSRGVLALPHLV